ASVAAAEARGSRPLVVVRPWHRVVAPLAGDAVRPVQHPSVHDDARADAGAQDRAEDDVGAAPGAVRGLREREAVRVVRDAYRAPQQRLEVAPDRMPVEA